MRIVVHGLILCVLVCTAAAQTKNPYAGIVERNVFHLVPPPDPTAAEAEKTKAAQPKVVLTGITTVLGPSVALMKCTPATPEHDKPQGGERSLILREGQRDGEVQVLQIDAKAGKVEISINNEHQWIAFAEKTTAAAPPQPAPPAPPVAPMMPMRFPRALTGALTPMPPPTNTYGGVLPPQF